MTIENFKRTLGSNVIDFMEKNGWNGPKERRMPQDWIGRPFLLLLRKGGGRLVGGLEVDPSLHSALVPAIRIEVRTQENVHKILPLNFRLSGGKLKRPIVLRAERTLKMGVNTLYPETAIDAQKLAKDRYLVEVSIPADFIVNKLSFKVGSPLIIGPDGIIENYDQSFSSGLNFQELLRAFET